MQINIIPVTNNSELKKFILLPWELYKNDKNWVPPLISEIKKYLDFNINPFFEHAEAEYFLAYQDNKVVGRIAAILNRKYNEFHNDKVGFFGFFECINNKTVSGKLFNTAASWLRKKGMEIMRGPMNFSTNDECGLLVEGYDTPPYLMMTHNPVYYSELISDFGFEKEMDLYAYMIDDPNPPERLERGSEIIKKRRKITIRTLDMNKFDEEIAVIKEIYNAAWEKNWGFVPFTEKEFDHLAKNLKQILEPKLVLIAYVEDKPAGFSLALPNLNQALIKLNGRLFPFGFLKLLYLNRKVDELRVITLGVKKEFRKLGIDTVFIHETFKTGYGIGYRKAELSWILETNTMLHNITNHLNVKRYKTYRIYDYKLNS
ncbi:N-acetyltransferase [candidate division KSB1 bacterium]